MLKVCGKQAFDRQTTTGVIGMVLITKMPFSAFSTSCFSFTR